ncbi:21080_t:CDS:10 [Rhizophagus irregularis]|nr:21080_t:CDS:10 [Rhizophagus irregularis]
MSQRMLSQYLRDIGFYRGAIERKEDPRKYYTFLTDHERLIDEELLRHGTVDNSKNSERKQKESDDDDFQPVPDRQQKRKKNLSLPKNTIYDQEEVREMINNHVEAEENTGNSNDQFVEWIEDYKPTSKTCRSWVLRSGTNEEITVKRDVTLIESDIPDIVIYFFNEVEKITKKENENIVKEIERLSPEIIEKNNHVELTNEEKDIVDNIRRATITYAENLKRLELLISEGDFDNNFPNMLTKRFLEKQELKMDGGEISCWASSRRRNEGRSIILHARIGRKSGGLPVAHCKKIFEDRIDLSIAIHDVVLYDFSSLIRMHLETTSTRRRLSDTKLPNTLKSLAVLEGFYALMSDVKVLYTHCIVVDIKICDHTNDVSLSNSRAHRNRKRKNSAHNGSFGIPSASSKKKFKKIRIKKAFYNFDKITARVVATRNASKFKEFYTLIFM